MKLLALLAALPLQYQSLWLVSSPDGDTRTSGRRLQAWRSTAFPRAIFSFGHGVNVSASTRPRHEGRRRYAGLLAQSPSLAQPRRLAMVRGVQASFGRVVPSLPVFVRRRGTGRLHQRRGLMCSNTEHVTSVYFILLLSTVSRSLTARYGLQDGDAVLPGDPWSLPRVTAWTQ